MVFERAYSALPTTVPSHASMFTALYPEQHRVLSNGLALAPGHWTLAELMSEAGFATAGFVSARAHFAAGGLAQGFAHFDEPADAADGDLP